MQPPSSSHAQSVSPDPNHEASPQAPGRQGAGPTPVLNLAWHYHFLGIGGVGMSALAELLHRRGFRVSGSDIQESETLARLRGLGIPAVLGHDPAALVGADAVVYSSAVRESHPIWAGVRRRGLPRFHRSELLAAVTEGERLLAVSGTHGKTTTSACLGHVLHACGWDPTVLVGGSVIQWEGANLRLGSSPWWVAEADESDGSFVRLSPAAILLTNVEPDHLDHHGSAANLERAFAAFLARLAPGGALVYCCDDPAATRLAREHGGRRIAYGLHAEAEVRVRVQAMRPGEMTLVVRDGSGDREMRTTLGGVHNAVNLAGVFALGRSLGLGAAALAEAIGGFRGVARRQQYLGQVGGYRLFDDYAHHPTEIRATLEMFCALYREPLTVVFQPHLYSRTADFAGGFAEALSLAERVFVTEIYAARESPIPGVSGRMIVERMRDHRAAEFCPDWRELPRRLVRERGGGGILLTLGAGDITGLGPLLLRGGPAMPHPSHD